MEDKGNKISHKLNISSIEDGKTYIVKTNLEGYLCVYSLDK